MKLSYNMICETHPKFLSILLTKIKGTKIMSSTYGKDMFKGIEIKEDYNGSGQERTYVDLRMNKDM